MRDISNLISAVTLESALATAALQALIASEQHLSDAQAQIATLRQQAEANALDPEQVTKLLDTVSTTTAQLSAAIPANAVPSTGDTLSGASTVTVVGAASVAGAGTDTVVQARDAAAAPAAPAAGTAVPAAPGAFAQPTETADAGLAAGPGPAVTTVVQP